MLLKATGIKKSFKNGTQNIEVLKGIDLEIEKGEMVSIMGVSGSGKSTLLHILGLLNKPDAGEIKLFDKTIDFSNEVNLANIRNKHIGFVFQFYSLIEEFTVLENIMIPFMISQNKQNTQRAKKLLEMVGLPINKADNYPSMLSGGELQRVALARALMNKPDLIIADEPTANLDKNSSIDIVNTMRNINNHSNQTFIIATHNEDVANRCDKILKLTGGILAKKT